MDTPTSDTPRRLLVLGGIGVVVLLALAGSQWLSPLRLLTHKAQWWVQDQVHLHGQRAPADPDIVVLGVDEASLDQSSAWPEDIEDSPTLQLMQRGWIWPRQVWVDLLEKLFAAGARVVALDFAFATPTPDHPEWDAALRDALEKWKDRVVIGADFQYTAGKLRLIPPSEIVLPATDLQAESRIGYFTYWPDEDGVVRHSALRAGEDRSEALSLPAAILNQARLPHRVPGGDPHQDHLIRFGPDDAYQPISVHELFIPALWESNFANGEIFRDKIVLVGPTVRHFQDDVPTPIGVLFGVQVHAHTLAAFRHGHLLREAGRPVIAGFAITGILGILLFLARFRRPVLGIAAVAGCAALAILIQTHGFNSHAFVIAMLVPALAAAAAGLLSLGYDYIQERRQRERLRAAITGYFSPDIEQQILRQPASYFQTLRGAHRHITLLFSDLRGFTSLSEKLPAQELVRQLNEYLDRMVQTVFETQGSIDKFIGDAIMAVWGRLRDDATEADLTADARAAVTTALRMREELAALNQQWTARGLPPLAVGIGLHQGEAVVGDMGSQLKKEFTAIGDTVNLAARLEGVTKEYGADLIVSEAIHHHLGDFFICRSADLVRVKGKQEPVAVFTVLGKTGEIEAPAGLAAYETGIRDYRAGRFAEAAAHFEAARAAGLDDSLTRLYQQRCADLLANPPEHWDGVFTMIRK